MTFSLTIFQTEKLSAYLVNKILRDNIAKGVISSEDNEVLAKVQARLAEEVMARLCITRDSVTFDELVSAIEGHININEYLNN